MKKIRISTTIDPTEQTPQTKLGLIMRSLTVVLTNLIPLYGVLDKGWNSFIVIVLFIAEGVIVLLADVIKRLLRVQKAAKGVLFFEFVFIFFFGFFAILIFGRDESSSNLLETIKSAYRSVKTVPLWSVVSIFAMRLVRTVQELKASGIFGGHIQQKLHFSGGGWMFLLFFLVMTAPFIADRGPNPFLGLIALIVLKSLGEIFAVWALRIDTKKNTTIREQDVRPSP